MNKLKAVLAKLNNRWGTAPEWQRVTVVCVAGALVGLVIGVSIGGD
jgi:hypothetical protein